jgi:nucleoside-diphosphate-sugar epimerase
MMTVLPKRALVTGATGYIGGQLCKQLMKAGWHVDALVRPTARKAEQLAASGVGVLTTDGSWDSILQAVGASAPALIFHLAGFVRTEDRPGEASDLIDANIRFPTLLVEAAMQRMPHPRLVNTGTYWQHLNESDYEPSGLYAATKQAFETLLRTYVLDGLTVTTLVLSDVYGPDDERMKLIRLLFDAAKTGATLALSPGEQRLDLVHVHDVCDAYLLAADRILTGKDAGAHRYAVRSGNSVSVRELVSLFENVSGERIAASWGARAYRRREPMMPWTGGETIPGWVPSIDLASGLADVLRSVGDLTPRAD